MQLWRFLTPKALGFALKMAREELVDRITHAPPRELRARDYVAQHARQNDPEDVLRTLDRFAVEVRFLMSVGPKKAARTVGMPPDGRWHPVGSCSSGALGCATSRPFGVRM